MPFSLRSLFAGSAFSLQEVGASAGESSCAVSMCSDETSEHEVTPNRANATHLEESPGTHSLDSATSGETASSISGANGFEDETRSMKMETELLVQARDELLSTSPKSWGHKNSAGETSAPPQTKRQMLENDESADSQTSSSSKHLRHVMAEIIQSERDYIASLHYIIVNYFPEVESLDVPQALRGKRNLVFGNVEKFYEFHAYKFERELHQYAEDPLGVGAAFCKYEVEFYMYALYNQNKPKCDQIMAECGNSFFSRKQAELDDKMNLASYLLKPTQRLAKYALLLQDLMKHCPERHHNEEKLKEALNMVKFLLRHGNDLLALESLRDCDLELKDYGRLLRQEEFLVYQGRKKYMRHLFLFEDLLVFSKTKKSRKGHDYYHYKNSLKMQDIGLTQNIGESGYKFEIWFRRLKAGENYVVQAPTTEIKTSWVTEFTKLLWDQALKKRDRRCKEMQSLGVGSKPFIDICPNADQINDRSVAKLSRMGRVRTSIAVPTAESITQHHNKRPHSLISMSSGSSASTLSSGSLIGSLTLANFNEAVSRGDTLPAPGASTEHNAWGTDSLSSSSSFTGSPQKLTSLTLDARPLMGITEESSTKSSPTEETLPF